MDNEQVAEILEEIGTLLELKGENPFKTRAYQNAARTIEGIHEPLASLVAEDRLTGIKGLGDALRQKITTLVETGKLPYFEELKASIPPGLIEMTEIPGLGPKKVKALHDELGIESIDALETACEEDRVAGLKGFGKKTQQKIIDGIEFRRKFSGQHHLHSAWITAEPILESLRQHPDVIRCSVAGSLRRWKETIGDLDFIASSRAPENVIDFFTNQEGILNIVAKGDTKASVILEDGLQADLRVVMDKEYPFTLAYFTGSKEHNIVMRQRAIDRGLRLNEYGLYKSKTETHDSKLRVKCTSEEDIFRALDLELIPPELRENRGEFEAAEKGELPNLVEWTDLRGSLHNHSNWSDGKESLEEVAAAAYDLGCSYWAITDHSQSSFIANGLDINRLTRQINEIEHINQLYQDAERPYRVLSGSEVDILTGGRLDFPDDILAQLDVVVASIHQVFSQSEAEMTKRLIGAAENRYVHMLGHITGRLLLQRDAYKLNQHAVIDACAETGTWIELNANPWRFDMDWRLWQYAKEKGVKCVINTDSHRFEHQQYLRFGAQIARKGWLTKRDVINTLSLKRLRTALLWKRK